MKKIVLLSLISLKFLLGTYTYTSPNSNDWNASFQSNEKSKIPGDNVVWAEYNEKTLDIFLRTTVDVYGVQFEFDGVTFKNINEIGFLKENKFEVSHNDNMLLSFSFQGKAIPKGEHKLISINLDYKTGKSNATMKSLVMAGKGGTALDFPYYDTNLKQITARTKK